jgi:hypothetical protein
MWRKTSTMATESYEGGLCEYNEWTREIESSWKK